jgi:hypothetical protein
MIMLLALILNHKLKNQHKTSSNLHITTITKVKICHIPTMSVVAQPPRLDHNHKPSLMMVSVWTTTMERRQ